MDHNLLTISYDNFKMGNPSKIDNEFSLYGIGLKAFGGKVFHVIAVVKNQNCRAALKYFQFIDV